MILTYECFAPFQIFPSRVTISSQEDNDIKPYIILELKVFLLFSCFQSIIIYSIAVFVYGINWMEITKSSLDAVQIHIIIRVFKKL